MKEKFLSGDLLCCNRTKNIYVFIEKEDVIQSKGRTEEGEYVLFLCFDRRHPGWAHMLSRFGVVTMTYSDLEL